MKAAMWFAIAFVLFFFLFASVAVAGELDIFVNDLNVEAGADLGGFRANLAAQFGISGARVDVLLRSVDHPGDAYMCLRIGQVAHLDTEVVLREYHSHKNKGWGVIAKNLGIKPGSKEFHALKNGYKGSGSKRREKAKAEANASGLLLLQLLGGR